MGVAIAGIWADMETLFGGLFDRRNGICIHRLRIIKFHLATERKKKMACTSKTSRITNFLITLIHNAKHLPAVHD